MTALQEAAYRHCTDCTAVRRDHVRRHSMPIPPALGTPMLTTAPLDDEEEEDDEEALTVFFGAGKCARNRFDILFDNINKNNCLLNVH